MLIIIIYIYVYILNIILLYRFRKKQGLSEEREGISIWRAKNRREPDPTSNDTEYFGRPKNNGVEPEKCIVDLFRRFR